MTCIFLPQEEITSNEIRIKGEQARHLSVLRIKQGETIRIFDGKGNRYTSKVVSAHKKEFIVEIIEKEAFSAESPLSITLAQGMPKGDKMELIIQKAAELGVRTIVPVITEHADVRETAKLERWRKIALSASEQCGREKIPEVEEPVPFEKFLKNFPSPLFVKEGYQKSPPLKKGDEGGFLGIIFAEEQKERNLKQTLTNFTGIKNITLLIGPEGGFSSTEVASAKEKGFLTASLGPRILRTETAAITALSIIQYELGDMGEAFESIPS
ncbi:MAG: 16S rRNA (uracil(1498)-N(3))-methyltransferase [Nitrospirae bacterium]|nr:16S rRNA (uracil(1498)-N(3))-methyltransferase [Nitrospirota bacterium]